LNGTLDKEHPVPYFSTLIGNPLKKLNLTIDTTPRGFVLFSDYDPKESNTSRKDEYYANEYSDFLEISSSGDAVESTFNVTYDIVNRTDDYNQGI
jgi:hypothetical protein